MAEVPAGNLCRRLVSLPDMPRFRQLIWLLWVWCFPCPIEAAALAIESPGAHGAIELTDLDGTPRTLTSVEARSVVEGPWVFTELEVAFRNTDAPGTLRVALPPHSIPIDRAFAPKLEQKEGNVWERQFDQHATRVQIAYVLEITQPRMVLVPLAGQRVRDRVAVQVTDQAARSLAEPLEMDGGIIPGDVVLRTTASESTVRSKDLAAIPLRVPGKLEADPLIDTLFLVDTSASGHETHARQLELVHALLARSKGRVALVAFDQEVESVYDGLAASAVQSGALTRLARRGALGATDLAGALRSVTPLVQSRSFRRVVLVSDGITSLSRGESPKLKELVERWGRFGVRRLDAVVLRSQFHDSRLFELATTALPERGVVVAAADTFDSLTRLELKTTAELSVSVDGADAQTPRMLRGFVPGDLVWIYARVPAARPLNVRVAGVPLSVSVPREAYYPLLERVFAQRGIGAPPKPPRDFAAEQLEISDGQLKAIEVRRRHPVCLCGGIHISGRLPPETIQRTVRLNHGRFRGCYQQALLSQPKLAGRVAVRFVIGPVGHVTSVRDEGSTLESPTTTRCILQAFSQLEFPMPEGGDVTVVYPLWLTPDGTVEHGDSPEETSPPPAKRVELLEPQYPLRPRDVGEEAYLGDFAALMAALRERRWHDAQAAQQSFELQSRQDLISMLARAQYAEQRGELDVARRAYGSLLNLYPHSAPIRRLVAAHWTRLGDAAAKALVQNSLEATEALDADCGMNQRQLAWSWVKDGEPQRALELLIRTVQRCSQISQATVSDLLRHDVGMIARAAIASAPARKSEVFDLLRNVGVRPSSETSLRFLLLAERGKGLSLGLYPDLFSGRVRGLDHWFGPHHAFSIADKDRHAPYTVHVRNLTNTYAARQATSFGYVEIVEQDHLGMLHVDHRPFLFQTSRSEVDLGKYGLP